MRKADQRVVLGFCVLFQHCLVWNLGCPGILADYGTAVAQCCFHRFFAAKGARLHLEFTGVVTIVSFDFFWMQLFDEGQFLTV